MYRRFREPFPALSHLFGALLSLVGLILLIQISGSNGPALLVSIVYGMSLIILYSSSCLAHGVQGSTKRILQVERYDLAAIFLLIAGTYTPICVFLIKGALGLTILGFEWLLAAAGIWNVFSKNSCSKVRLVPIYLVMGWLFIGALGPITASQDVAPLLIAGSAVYSIGAIVFLLDWPPLWKGMFSGHDFWHVLVLAGSVCHFLVVQRLIEAATKL